jgi:hypothetical protein
MVLPAVRGERVCGPLLVLVALGLGVGGGRYEQQGEER